MRLREDFTGFLLDVQQPLQPLHQQRGDLLDLLVGETTFGARGFARMKGKLLGQTQQLEFGYLARGDLVTGLQQRIDNQTNQPYLTETNLASTLGDIGAYVAADLKPVSWISLRGGIRTEVFTYTVNNLCAVQDVAHPTVPTGGASCLTAADFGAHVEANQVSSTAAARFLPRAALIVGPFQALTISANYGQGAQSIDPIYITQDVATPFATVTAYDGGVSYARSFEHWALSARSIGFLTHLDKDLIFSEVQGAGTTRTGWIVALRATGDFFDESANATFVKSAYDDTHLLVPYVPDIVVRSDTSVFAKLPVRLGGHPFQGAVTAAISYIGPRALPFGERSDAIVTLDASATLRWRDYSLGLVLTNVLNSQYRLSEYNYASNFQPFLPQTQPSEPTLAPMRQFTAGAPRGIFGTLSITFGGV